MSSSHPVVEIVKPGRKPSRKLPPNFYLRGDVIYVRFKARHSIKGINESTNFTVLTAEQREAGIKKGYELIAAERLNPNAHIAARVKVPEAVRLTVQMYFDGYKARFLAEEPTKAQIATTITIVEPFVAHFADRYLDEITDEDCRTWVKLRQRTKSRRHVNYLPGSVRSECDRIKRMFNRAVGKGKPLVESPWNVKDDSGKLTVVLPAMSIRERILSKAEFKELTRALFAFDVETCRMFLIVFSSGLRRKEFTYLRSRDVVTDEHGTTIYVRKETAKKGKARQIPVGAEVAALINAQRAHLGLAEDSPGRLWPWTGETLGRRIKIITARLGWPQGWDEKITNHDVRRTFASDMADILHPKELMKLLGHAKLETGMRHYVKADNERIAVKVRALPSRLPDVTLSVTVQAESE